MILVIGIGNPLRSDDGVGQAAALEIGRCLPSQDVEILAVHQLTPELVEPISRAERVIFLDADVEHPPGHIEVTPIRPSDEAAGAFTHHVSPAGLLLGAQQLYETSPKGYLISIGASSFDFSETFSPQVQAAFFEYVTTVRQLIED